MVIDLILAVRNVVCVSSAAADHAADADRAGIHGKDGGEEGTLGKEEVGEAMGPRE